MTSAKWVMAAALLSAGACLATAADPLTLWYRQPAKEWEQALPLGNGRMGAMVFGGVESERIQFNEHTVWTGEPHDYAHHGASKYLAEIRRLLFEGKQKEAQDLAWREFMSVPPRERAYQAFGDIQLKMAGDGVNRYRRSLDLDTAIATLEYERNGVTFRREVLASAPDQVIAIRLTASQPGQLTFTAALASAHANSKIANPAKGVISMTGAPQDSAIRFEARMQVLSEGGTVQNAEDNSVQVTGANAATLLLTGATNFVDFRNVSGNPAQRNDAVFAKVREKSWDKIRAAHIADHQRLFRRVTLDLGRTAAVEMPTDERIAAFAQTPDPQLVTLLFQFGRYLMIGSSRSGGQPANLQGLWNDSNKPAWDSKYTVNINTEMNYWPVESTNLGECHQALFAALREVAQSGEITAREHYGARGWVLHHNFDLWRGTAPINGADHGIWQTGGAWLAQHLWTHYLYSGDRKFLADTAYPLMRGAALFFVDALVKDPRRGWLISGPSNSPEQGGLVMGPTMDHQVVRGIFTDVIAASTVLGIDADLRAQLEKMRGEIAPNQIGKYGQLQEWLEDVDDPKNQHRHVSHLWGVFPGGEITPYGTPDLFAAARKSLEFRGDTATGWSMGWKVNLWARFLDGDHADVILRNLLTPAANFKPGVRGRAGVFPNLFDSHPPFQIDGNFGATSGITEMLMQSHDPYAKPATTSPVEAGNAAFVHLLPALPSAWPTGKVSGLKARGGLEVGLEWSAGKLVGAQLTASRNLPVRVRYAGKEVEIRAVAGKTYRFGPALETLR